MARPVGDEHFSRPGAASGNECEPDPATAAEHADDAESAARYAVEGKGITVNPPRKPTTPTQAAGAA